MSNFGLGKGFAAPRAFGSRERNDYERLSSYVARLPEVVRTTAELVSAIWRLGNRATSLGGTILLADGIYELRETLEITTPNVHIVSLSPGNAVFWHAAAEMDDASGAMIVLGANGCRLSGVRFKDYRTAAIDADAVCVSLDDDYGVLDNCVFEACHASFVVLGDWCRVSNILVMEATASVAAAVVQGANGAYSNVQVADDTPAVGVYANDGATNCVFSNVLMHTNPSVSYRGADGSDHASCVPAPTVR